MKKETNKLLSTLTSWKIGGPASLLLIPESKEELVEAVAIGKEAGRFFVIGNGTNVLAKDEGFTFPLIKLGKYFSNVNITGTSVLAGASTSLISLAIQTARAGLANLEFAAGIPGTLGGAVIMNAGAHGLEMKDIIIEVQVYDTKDEKYKIFNNHEMEFSYRNSILKNNSRYVVVEALMGLSTGNKNQLMERIKKNKEERIKKQPYEYPNSGSVFKNPPGYSAGQLIEEANLKGFSINDAEISMKHGNFIINKGKASSKDVNYLMEHIKRVIKEKYGLKLESEIIILE